jgi:hypothetical protein
MWQVCEGREIHTGFWRRNLKERHYLEHAGIDKMIILKMILKEI